MSILEHYGASFRPNQNAKSRLHLGEYVKALRYHEQADLTAIARWLSTTQRERIISGVPSWLAFAERWIRSKVVRSVQSLAEALYDVDSIVADPGAYIKEELAALHSQIISNLEWAWELLGGSEDQLLSTMMQVVMPANVSQPLAGAGG